MTYDDNTESNARRATCAVGKGNVMARKAHTQLCTKCGAHGVIGNDDPKANDFYRDKSQASGFAAWCKSCERTYNKAYFAGLKKAEAPRKRDIDNDKALGAFERTMKSERIKRGTFSRPRVNAKAKDTKGAARATQPKARATSKAGASSKSTTTTRRTRKAKA